MTSQQDRFKEAPWFPQDSEPVMIGGAGGIGSWLAFFLAKIGYSPIVYDFDIIEEHNLGGQLFRQKDVGSYKVGALQKIIEDFCGDNISTSTDAIDSMSPAHHYCFSAFDNMKARKDLFAAWQRSIPHALANGIVPVFIDGRLEIEQLQIFCVTPDNQEKYLEHLFDDSEVEDAPCSMKQSSHTAAMIASLMSAFFTNHITNVYAKQIIREVPFYYEYIVPMNLTISNNG
jgi:molybdopterin/thiamine biosynthesis adenylyltransferase